jgi:hyperosmotically inducible protein
MFVIALVSLSFTAATMLTASQPGKTPQLGEPQSRETRQLETLKERVRHELVMLPYYGVFDWIEGQVKPDGTVTLRGEVTRPTLKSDAADRLLGIEAITRVVNKIEVLPLSSADDDLRIAIYRAIFRFDGPLFRYSNQPVPPIHIIVKNGRVTLKGVVLNQMDSQLAETAARTVPGSFEIRNELKLEQGTNQKKHTN